MEVEHDHMGAIVEEDRLSRLPDHLIHQILSFMDIKFAIQTSSLSSRWKLIWTSMPYLNLSSEYFSTLPKFAKFVAYVLSRRNNQTEVSSVKLCFRGKVSQVFVRRIINYAFSHNVQHFTISCSHGRQTELPHSLFSSYTLKHLSLNAYPNQYCFTPTSPWNFPALTTLHLGDVTLCDDNTDKHLGLFAKCVNLKNLTLHRFVISGSDVFNVCTPNLTSLSLCYEMGGPGIINVVALKLENLHISDCRKKCQVLAPALSFFFFEGSCPSQVSLDCCPSLEKVTLLKNVRRFDKEAARRIVGLLQEVHCAKFLTLNLAIIEALSANLDLLSNQPSPFGNLKCLKICQNKWEKPKFKRETISSEVKNYFVGNSPNATVIMDFPKMEELLLVVIRHIQQRMSEGSSSSHKGMMESNPEGVELLAQDSSRWVVENTYALMLSQAQEAVKKVERPVLEQLTTEVVPAMRLVVEGLGQIMPLSEIRERLAGAHKRLKRLYGAPPGEPSV